MDLKTCRWMTRLLYGVPGAGNHCPPLDNQILRMGLLGAALALALMVAMVGISSGAAPSVEKCSPKRGQGSLPILWVGDAVDGRETLP